MSQTALDSVAVHTGSEMGVCSKVGTHQKEPELKTAPTVCVICGENDNFEERVDSSVDSMLEFIKSSCGLSTEIIGSQPLMCLACLNAIKKMQEAQRLQRALIQRCESRSKNGKNGTKPMLMTNLFKPGNDCNLPEPAQDMLSQTTTSEGGGIELIITDVKTCPPEECSLSSLQKEHHSNVVRSVSTDTRDLINNNIFLTVEQELITLDCNAEDDADHVDSLLGNVQIKQEVIDPELKPPTLPDLPSSSSYDLSRWLPSTSMSEKSFELGFPHSDFSSISKGKLSAQPSNGWKCRMCKETFSSSGELVTHIHTAHSDMTTSSEVMACPFCSKQFPTYTQLDDHITKLHGDGSHSCSGCYQVYQRASLLRQHKLHCTAYQNQQRDQKQAMLGKLQQDDEKKEVMRPSEVEQAPSEVKGDREVNNQLKCEACAEVNSCVLALFKHQDTCPVLLQWMSAEENSQFTAQIRCQGCTVVYTDIKLYKSHIEVCRLFQLSSFQSASTPKVTGDSTLFDKAAVKKEVKSENNLETIGGISGQESFVNTSEKISVPLKPAQEEPVTSTGLQASNSSEGEKSASNTIVNGDCSQSKNLSNSSNQLKSPNSHSNIRQPFMCDVCGMDFNFKSLMDFHMVIHTDTDSKPFRCTGCKAGFDAAKHKDCHERLCAKTRAVSSLKKERGLMSPPASVGVKQEPMDVKESSGCTKCHLHFEDAALDRSHQISCDTNKCHFCKFLHFDSAGELQAHVTKLHHWSSERVCCPICPAYFTSNCFLDYHRSTQHNTNSLMSISESPSKLTCNECASTFSCFVELQSHLLNCKLKSETSIAEPAEAESNCTPDEEVDSDTPNEESKHSHDEESNQNPDEVENLKTRTRSYSGSDGKSSSRHGSGTGSRSNASEHSVDLVNKTHSQGFCCSGCGHVTHFWANAQKHMKTCTEFIEKWSKYKVYEVHCFMCFIGFSTASNLKIHIQAVHMNDGSKSTEEIHRCKACNATCSTSGSLKSHESRCVTRARKLSAANPENTCGVCLVELHPQSLDRHFKNYHEFSLNNMKCGACGDGFLTLIELAAHMKECLCIRSLLHSEIKSRRNVVPENPQTEVELMDQSFNKSDSESISTTSNLSKNDVCKICGAWASRDHIFIHSAEAKRTRELACPGCDGRFSHNSGLAKHTITCVRFKALNPDEDKVSSVPKPLMDEAVVNVPKDVEITPSSVVLVPLKCLHCGETFSSTDLYTEHERKCKTSFDTGNKPPEHNKADENIEDHEENDDNNNDNQSDEWKCLSCCFRFSDETQFLLHIASHEVTNVNSCFICYGTFKTAADICTHMVKHHKLFLTTGLRQEGDEEVALSDQETLNIVNDSSFTVLSEPSPQTANTPSLRSTNSKPAASRRSGTPSTSLVSPHATPPAIKSSPSTKNRLSLPKFNHDRITGTVCSVCKRKFATNAILKKHYGIHDGYCRYICLVCGSGFQKENHCKSHKAKCHRQNSGEFKCPKCDAGFLHKFRRDQHVDICLCGKYDEVVRCFFCPQTFPSWTQAMGHMPIHLRKCTFCDLKLDTHLAKTKHILECPKNPLLKPQRFPARSENNKTSKWPTSTPSDTSINNSPTVGTPSVNSRLRNKVRLKCTECCFETFTQTSLRKHMNQHESAEYRCRVCGGKFNSLLAKNRHMLREHGKSTTKIIKAAPKAQSTNDGDHSPGPESPITPTATFYACEKCDQCFHTKEEKTLHERTFHDRENASIKAFNCKLCDKRFPSKFARRRHMQKNHSGLAAQTQSQSFSCYICTKPFSSNFAKLQHLKKAHDVSEPDAAATAATEVGKKLRPCKICDAVFEHKSELKAHRQEKHADVLALRADLIANKDQQYTADGERKRICKICFSTFEHKSDLKNHYKMQHVKPPPLASPAMESSVKVADNKPANQDPFPEKIATPVPLSASLANKASALSASSDKALMSSQSVAAALLNARPVEANTTANEDENNPAEKRKLRVCKECDRLFDTKAELKAHRKSEHKKHVFVIPDSPSPSKRSPEKISHVVSDIVDLTSDPEEDNSSLASPPAKQFKASESIPSSTSYSDKDGSSLPFRCEHCSKGFKLRISLNKHIAKAH